ncbi:MAG: methionyl-tRNA formyltransferase [Pseudomonadota bacterium]|nr:methionyl-tRNA formyltransferase [Pseudomonadota bacterium]
MRVVFAGTPEFAARALEAIAGAGHVIPLVLTQPDRPAGRGLKLTSSAVARAAERLSIPVEKPATLKSSEALEGLRAVRADVMVVAAYGLILPRAVLDLPRLGCLNIHASLLPRWRGAAPIHRAILAGDARTGVSIMRMEEGLDTGPVLLEEAVPIGLRETTGSLTVTLSDLGATAIVAALGTLESLVPRTQDTSLATYASKITKADARLDWSRRHDELDRQVRALNPVPGAEGVLEGEVIKVWSAEPVAEARGLPGSIVRAQEGELLVACGTGGLRLLTVQRAGGRKMGAAEFLRGNALGATAQRN